MKISQEAITGANIIRDYGDGFLFIQTSNADAVQITEPTILTKTEQVLFSIFASDLDLIDYLKAQSCDLLILINDSSLDLSDYAKAQLFVQSGMPTEIMKSGAAYRTFNLLIHEGRAPALCIQF